MKSDYDGAWKNLVGTHLREVLTLFFPGVAQEIDWRAAPKLLAQELKTLGIEEDALGGQRVDFLIEVATKSGARQVVFLHLEIQSKKEPDFARRIYRYNQRIAAATELDVVTLVVLADLNPQWRPRSYEREIMGCRVAFEFPICKLLDLLPVLGKERKLAALAVRAQIAGLETSGSPQRRLAKRLELCQQFLGQGWNKKQIVEAFRLVAWMMRLPRVESLQFREVVSGWEKMKTTLPLTDLEEIWLEEGIEKGIEQGIEQGIERGIERGIEKGRQEGEWIGKIELLEKLLGKTQTASVILKKETLKQLQSRFNKLEKEYDAKHRPLDRRASNGPNPNPRKAPSA